MLDADDHPLINVIAVHIQLLGHVLRAPPYHLLSLDLFVRVAQSYDNRRDGQAVDYIKDVKSWHRVRIRLVLFPLLFGTK